MNENSDTPTNKRNIWIRGLFMLLMAFAFQVCGTVMCIVAVIQFVMMLLNDTPNARPEFATIWKVIRAPGIRLHARPAISTWPAARFGVSTAAFM